MRILILHARYLSWLASGENRVVDDEARLLREAGHDVEVWDPGFTPGGMKVVRRGLDAIWSQQAASKVRQMIEELQPEIVHVHNLFPTISPAALRVGTKTNAAIVMTLHNYRLTCLPGTLYRDGGICELCVGRDPWPGVKYRCLRDSRMGSAALASSIALHRRLGSFDDVSRYFAITRFVRDKHVQAGFPPDRIVVKRNWAWSSPRREGPGDQFVFLGRIAPEKGLETLIDAFRDLPARLLVVGEGVDFPRLLARAPSNVDFRGPVPPNEVPEILRHARALLVPSRWYEPATKTIPEAAAAGVPSIASRIGGIPEMLEDGVSGVLVPPRDVQAWCKALTDLMDDATSVEMGEAAYAGWQQQFSPEIALKELEGAYEEVLRIWR